MNQTACAVADRDELAARYVAGTLGAAELEQLELHLLACPQCRAAVQQAAELRTGLRRVRSVRRSALLLPAGAAVAAALAWLLLTPDSIARLGHVDEPPTIDAMNVRAPADSAAEWARSGIEAYRSKDYDRAAILLRRAHEVQPAPGTAFFLAVSLLMSDRPDSAVAVFREVTSTESVYRPEAHYFAAKAWLRRGHADSATSHLRHLAGDGPLGARARALLDSIAEAQ